MGKRSALSNAVDEHIGQRVQLRRQMLGYTQKDLAEMCGISFQQIQKYETADNRISASRLFTLSTVLETPVSFFFLGLPGNFPEETKANKSMRVSELLSADDPLGKNESLDLIIKFWALPDDADRARIWQFIRSRLGNADATTNLESTLL
ncbi:MAG: helix-turn-helix domain-containing protein [Alphaproteobacteria bacterium]|nr:helix-turn-helix domain-containing protein [Alphaproteobacteria bacterium]